jgi:hypothetical protein
MLPDLKPGRPVWIICEDGSEYLERFQRFLDDRFRFVHALDGPALLAALAGGASGIILDLDFRRTPRERLVDEQGRAGRALAEDERRRLASQQGILILRLLRARGFAPPVLLFADLDDASQVSYLESTLAPLSIVPSHEGLRQTADRMQALG